MQHLQATALNTDQLCVHVTPAELRSHGQRCVPHHKDLARRHAAAEREHGFAVAHARAHGGGAVGQASLLEGVEAVGRQHLPAMATLSARPPYGSWQRVTMLAN